MVQLSHPYMTIGKTIALNPVNHKGNQSWLFIGRTDVEAETPILWPPDMKNWPLGKDPDARKDRRQDEKGTTEDEMVGWHHWLDGYELEQAPGVGGDRQESLVCCSPWSQRDRTEQLNWTEMYQTNIPHSFLLFINWVSEALSYLSTAKHQVTQSLFTRHLLYARRWTRCWRYLF